MPGLVDAHVHLREPGMEYKEDFYTGTAAALAGGVTMVLDMPNTLPVATEACGLKIYVNETFGSLRIDELGLMHQLFRTWAETADKVGYRTSTRPGGVGPIAVHAEDLMVPVCLCLSELYGVPLHVVHVSRRSEIELLRRAKDLGQSVTCEVTPHHLFLSQEDAERLGPLGDMRPRLGSPDDVAALWENLDVVDIFATDHAPHTLDDKGIVSPVDDLPPGVPGLETMLPLLLTAVDQGRLSLEDILERCIDAPRRVYGLPLQQDTYIEVDIDTVFQLSNSSVRSKCGWTPFAGMDVVGRVERVVLRGDTVYDGGQVRAERGKGKVLFWEGRQ